MFKSKITRGTVLFMLLLLILPLALYAGGKKEEPKNTVDAAPSNSSTAESTDREPITGVPAEAAAIVNGVMIPTKIYNGQVQAILQQYAKQGVNLQDAQQVELKNKVLENLIDQELLYQDANSTGLTVSDDAVNAQFETVKSQFPDDATYKKALEAQNITEEEIKADIGKTLLVENYINNKYKSSVKIDDADVLKFYQDNSQYFTQPEQVRASHILIKVDPDAEDSVKKDAMDRIKAIKVRLNNGEEFSDLARELSEGPSNTNGGDLGAFGHGQMVKPFEDAVFSMNVGDVSDVVETQFGYHLIKLTAKNPSTTIPLENASAKIVDHLTQLKMAELVNAYVATLKPDAKIERFIN